MVVACNLVGKKLPGQKWVGEWTVVERVFFPDEPGLVRSSVCYRVRHARGKEAFLKAADMDTVTEGNDLLARMYAFTQSQTFERKILMHCHGNAMDRVVTPLDYGEKIENHDNTKEVLFWLVFELARNDARIQVKNTTRLDLNWAVTALKNTAVGFSQLHTAGVTHNDGKPENVLIFNDAVQKLCDLGSAVSADMPAVHDEKVCIGDPRFAPPEVLYCCEDDAHSMQLDINFRKATDLYLLGSLGYYFLTGNMLTPQVLSHMQPGHLPPNDGRGWTGTFKGILPYYRTAFVLALQDLDSVLPRDQEGNLTGESIQLRDSIQQLCEPDRLLRGHPEERRGKHNPFNLQKYISLYNSLKFRV